MGACKVASGLNHMECGQPMVLSEHCTFQVLMRFLICAMNFHKCVQPLYNNAQQFLTGASKCFLDMLYIIAEASCQYAKSAPLPKLCQGNLLYLLNGHQQLQ